VRFLLKRGEKRGVSFVQSQKSKRIGKTPVSLEGAVSKEGLNYPSV